METTIFSLPVEVRALVFEALFDISKPVQLLDWDYEEDRDLYPAPTTAHPQILRTCRQFQIEGTPLLYRKPILFQMMLMPIGLPYWRSAWASFVRRALHPRRSKFREFRFLIHLGPSEHKTRDVVTGRRFERQRPIVLKTCELLSDLGRLEHISIDFRDLRPWLITTNGIHRKRTPAEYLTVLRGFHVLRCDKLSVTGLPRECLISLERVMTGFSPRRTIQTMFWECIMFAERYCQDNITDAIAYGLDLQSLTALAPTNSGRVGYARMHKLFIKRCQSRDGYQPNWKDLFASLRLSAETLDTRRLEDVRATIVDRVLHPYELEWRNSDLDMSFRCEAFRICEVNRRLSAETSQIVHIRSSEVATPVQSAEQEVGDTMAQIEAALSKERDEESLGSSERFRY